MRSYENDYDDYKYLYLHKICGDLVRGGHVKSSIVWVLEGTNDGTVEGHIVQYLTGPTARVSKS